jgi:hypothetical protein
MKAICLRARGGPELLRVKDKGFIELENAELLRR